MRRVVFVSSSFRKASVRSFRPIFQTTRFQSQKSKFPLNSPNDKVGTTINEKSTFEDPKLREIIETTNFGTVAIQKKKEAEEKRIKQEQEEQEKKIRAEKQKQKEKEEAERAKLEQEAERTEKPLVETKETDSKSSNGINKNQYKNITTDKVNLTADSTTNTHVFENQANQLAEQIKGEIGNLPSQEEERKNQYYKKVEAYLESLQGTIFRATRALNDVTGYTAIAKLKKSIEQIEAELREAKEEAKSNRATYSEAILRRSNSQREVNELLTRKHNWTPEDLERFTELYRNDHLNEQLEQEAELKVEEAEQKADSIQLKLTQSILTRYHEEQIWSDKIRRASTWGTWILMGINIMLFVVATLIVEPWKRRRLVASFEDKVKQVLVDLAENDKVIMAPILEAQAGTVAPSEKVVEFKEEPVAPPLQVDPQVKESVPFVFTLVPSSWNWGSIKSKIEGDYLGLVSNDVVQFNKADLGILSTLVITIGCGIGSLVTLYLTK
ncbi:hypothetical protein G9P44_000085 [Scheffersomyces stipitis]|nr:hypothetical protein G9P44_000085 [Scheffersomyces stipitis]